jgi:O-antigen ligase
MNFIKVFKNFYSYEKIIYLLIPIFVLSLVSGPFLPDLFVSIIALSFLYFFIKNFKIFIRDKIVKILFIFYLYIVCSSFFSQVPIESLKTSIFYIRFLIFVIAINIFLLNTKYKNIIFFAFLILYSALFFDSIYQIFNEHNIFKQVVGPAERISSFFGDELIMGSFVARTFPIVLYLFFEADLKNKNFIYCYMVFISLFCVIVSAERTSLLIYFIVFFGSLFFFNKKKIIKIFIFYFIVLFLTFLVRPAAFERLYKQTLLQLSGSEINDHNKKFKLFSYRHELHYATALQIFQDHKFFGAGIKSFRYLCLKDNYSQKEKIIKDNLVYATKKDVGTVFQHFEKKNAAGKIVGYGIIREHYLAYLKATPSNPLKITEINIDQHIYVPYIKNGSPVKEGDLLFSFYEFKNGCNTHAHNFYMQFLAELGLVGFGFILFFLIATIYKIVFHLYKLLKNQKLPSKFILYVGYFSVLFPIQPSGNFFNNYLALLTILPLCFFELCKKK